jgi:hypothetical protein
VALIVSGLVIKDKSIGSVVKSARGRAQPSGYFDQTDQVTDKVSKLVLAVAWKNRIISIGRGLYYFLFFSSALYYEEKVLTGNDESD